MFNTQPHNHTENQLRYMCLLHIYFKNMIIALSERTGRLASIYGQNSECGLINNIVNSKQKCIQYSDNTNNSLYIKQTTIYFQ